jgi:hypothetical protein
MVALEYSTCWCLDCLFNALGWLRSIHTHTGRVCVCVCMCMCEFYVADVVRARVRVHVRGGAGSKGFKVINKAAVFQVRVVCVYVRVRTCVVRKSVCACAYMRCP